jgi:hypothetical protein
MKTRVLMATVGAAAGALAAGVVWVAPAASATTPYCDGLAPRDARECNCGFDFPPGSPELQGCLAGNVAAPAPGAPAPGAPGVPPPAGPPPAA